MDSDIVSAMLSVMYGTSRNGKLYMCMNRRAKRSRETIDRKRMCLFMEWKKKEYRVIVECVDV